MSKRLPQTVSPVHPDQNPIAFTAQTAPITDGPVCAVTAKQCSLNCLSRGEKGRVAGVAGPNRCRLLELGFTRGTEVEISRRAAFGGPLEVRLRSYRLSLRCDEAEAIQVETGDARG